MIDFLKTVRIRIQHKLEKIILSCIILCMKPHKADSSVTDVGVCSLLCHKDVNMYILAVTSFYYAAGHNYPIFIANDSTLTDSDIAKLHKYFTVVIPSEGERLRHYNKTLYPDLWEYRSSAFSARTKRKFDAILFNPFSRFIVLDADILFFHSPKFLIRFINKDVPQRVYYGGRHKNVFDSFPYVMGCEYPFRSVLFKQMHQSMDVSFNIGLLCVGSHNLVNQQKLNQIFKYFKYILYRDSSMADETGLSLLWSRREATMLDPDEYIMASFGEELAARDISRAVAIHYMGDHGLKDKCIHDGIRLALSKKLFKQ